MSSSGPADACTTGMRPAACMSASHAHFFAYHELDDVDAEVLVLHRVQADRRPAQLPHDLAVRRVHKEGHMVLYCQLFPPIHRDGHDSTFFTVCTELLMQENRQLTVKPNSNAISRSELSRASSPGPREPPISVTWTLPGPVLYSGCFSKRMASACSCLAWSFSGLR